MTDFILNNIEALTIIAVFTWWLALLAICYLKESEVLENETT